MKRKLFQILIVAAVTSSWVLSSPTKQKSVSRINDAEEFVSDTEKLNILPNDIVKEEPYVAENIVDVERFRRDTLLGNLIRNTGREADNFLKGLFAAGKKAK